MLSLCPFDISVDVGAFVIGLSQISSFFFKRARLSTDTVQPFLYGYFENRPIKSPFTTEKEKIVRNAEIFANVV